MTVAPQPKLLALEPVEVAQAFEDACIAELEAVKPGNVGYHGDGHRMVVADFEKSAAVASQCVAASGATVGARILTAVEATLGAVGQNTNLGIVLLCAPLAHAAQQPAPTAVLSQRSAATLGALDLADARDAFRAISLAQPAGLGEVARHDVRAVVETDLREAMHAAADRDRIARQYAENFVDIFELGWPLLERTRAAGVATPWCTSAVYLGFLSAFSDSHIVRKYDSDVAERVQAHGLEQFRAFEACLQVDATDFYRLREQLIQLDSRWKTDGINPGTSADLTVATLFSMNLRELLEGRKGEKC